MANSPQARKRARQAEKSRRHNASARSMMRTYVKRVVSALDSGDAKAAEEAYRQAIPVIDSATRKGLMHRNKAARHKSRLNQRIRELNAA